MCMSVCIYPQLSSQTIEPISLIMFVYMYVCMNKDHYTIQQL